MQTPEEITRIVTAFLQGGQVQWQLATDDPETGPWALKVNPEWQWDTCRYRIKPKTPRRFLVWVDAAGRPQQVSDDLDAKLRNDVALYGPIECVEVL